MSHEHLAENVEPDPDRTGDEKESAYTMLGTDKHFTAMSAKATQVRSLLKHDHFDPDWFTVTEDGRRTTVESVEAAEQAEAIHAVSGTLPIGCLTIKSKPRSQNNQSGIINSETIDPDAFS